MQELSSSTWVYQEDGAKLLPEVYGSWMKGSSHTGRFWFKGKKLHCGNHQVWARTAQMGRALCSCRFSRPSWQCPKQWSVEQKLGVETFWVPPPWTIKCCFYWSHGYLSVLLNARIHRRMEDLYAGWRSCWRISFWIQVTNTEILTWSSALLNAVFLKTAFPAIDFFFDITALYAHF